MTSNALNYFISSLLTAITTFGLAVFVLSRDTKSKLYRMFFFYTASISAWSLPYAFMANAPTEKAALILGHAFNFGVSFICVFFVHFVLILLETEKTKKLTVMKPLYAAAVIFTFLVPTRFMVKDVVPKFGLNYFINPGPAYYPYVLFWVGCIIYGLYKLFVGYRESEGSRRNQLKYLFFGSLIGYIGGPANFLLVFDIKYPSYPFGVYAVPIYIALAAYAIVRHKLMDIEVIVKKTLVFAGLFAASYAIFSGFVYLGSGIFENIVQNRWIAMVPSVLIVVIMLRPLESFLMNATDKYLFQKKYDYKHLLRMFTDEVLTVLDLNELVNLTVNKLAELMKLDNVFIMLHDRETDELRIAASVEAKTPEQILKGDEKLVAHVRKIGTGYVLWKDAGSKEGMDADIEKKIREMNADLIVPLAHHKGMVGILCLGNKKSDEEFTQDDIDILLPLAKTLSIAIANAQLFEKLSQAQASAAQREKMAVIGTLSAGINHEICNPLGIARGQCEMFLLNLKDGVYKKKASGELLEKAQEIMRKVIHETDRATSITKKLSSFAKPAERKMSDNVQVEEELDKVIALLEHDLKLENIVLTKDIQSDLPCISADRKQLQEIFFNIIRNAAQSITGSGKIIMHASSANKKVYIDIEDTGTGISKDHLDRIFDPFFTTKEPGKGTGLGLFIVRQIVEKNNGRISVRSLPGEGTIFNLIFDARDVIAREGMPC